MLCVLESSGITVPTTATLTQIRALYQQASPDLQQNGVQSGDSNETACIADGIETKENSESVNHDMPNSNEEATAEIIRLKQRIEVLELHNRLAELENRTYENATHMPKLLHPDEVKQIIPLLDENTSFTQWMRTVQHSAEMHSWDDQTTLRYASSQLTGAAKEWYCGFRNSITSLQTFTEGMGKAFPDQQNEAAIHKKLFQVFKSVDETNAAYIFRVNALGKTGNISNEAIITYIIRGLSRDPMYPNLLAKEFKDIYDLISHVKRCEIHLQMREPPTFIPRSSHPNRFASTFNTKAQSTNKREDVVRCFNCSSFGH